MKTRRNVRGLLNILRKKPLTYDQEREVAAAFKEIGDAAIELLITSLKEQIDEPIRWDAWALGEIGDTRAVEPLIIALKQGDKDLASTAAEALGKIKDIRSVEPLIEVLHSISAHKGLFGTVKYSVIEALGEIGDNRAVEPLIEILNNNRDFYTGVDRQR